MPFLLGTLSLMADEYLVVVSRRQLLELFTPDYPAVCTAAGHDTFKYLSPREIHKHWKTHKSAVTTVH